VWYGYERPIKLDIITRELSTKHISSHTHAQKLIQSMETNTHTHSHTHTQIHKHICEIT